MKTCNSDLRKLKLTKIQEEYIRKGRILLPDTKAILNQYKEPLTPVKGGYGYMGTIATNEEETHTQCHICGLFYIQVGRHITNMHDITVEQYKDKFEIAKRSSLVATKSRIQYFERYANMTPDEKLARMQRLQKASQDRRDKGQWSNRWKKSLEQKNKEGRCPDQLLDKIEKLEKKLGYTPSTREFAEEYTGGYLESVRTTYGTWSNAIKMLGLEPNTNHMKGRVSEKTIRVLFWDFKEKYGREPYSRDLKGNLGVSAYPITRIWGSFSNAKDVIFERK